MEVLSLVEFPVPNTLLVDLCVTMKHVKELNLVERLSYNGCDEVLRAISANMPKLQELNIAHCSGSLSAIQCLLPTAENPQSGCPDLQILNLLHVPGVTVELLKKIIICLPKLRYLKNRLMVKALLEITDEELGMNSGRCMEHLYLNLPDKRKDSSVQSHILQNAPVFAEECNVTRVDMFELNCSIVSTKDSLMPLKKLNSITFDNMSRKSRDEFMSLLESKGDCLGYLRLTDSYRIVSLCDIAKTCPKLEKLMVTYCGPDAESDSVSERNDRPILPCLKKINLYDVTKAMCSSETLISLLLGPQLEEISLSGVHAMSNDVMFKVLSSSRASLSKVKYFQLSGCPAITAAPFVQLLSKDNIALEDLHINYCNMVDQDVLHAAVEKCPQPLNVIMRPVSMIEFPRYLDKAQGPCVENCHCCAYKRQAKLKGPNSHCWKVSKILGAEVYHYSPFGIY